MRRIVFESAELRRVMRWRDDDAVRQAVFATAIVSEYCVRYYRRRCIAAISIDHYIDFIRCQHFQGACKSGLRKRVRIYSNVKWSIDALLLAVEANRLSDCEN